MQLGLSPEELVAAVPGAAALVIRSATQVTAEVLAAGTDLVVVGRAGIGLDNVDVAAATQRGVMVVNAPQSNVISAAEQTVALLLVDGAQHPAGRRRPQGRQVEPVALVGRRAVRQDARRRRSRPCRRARRAAVPVVRDAARRLRPVRERGPRAPARRRARAGPRRGWSATVDFLTIHLPKTPETLGLFDAELLAKAKPRLRIVNTARGGIIDEAVLAAALARRHDRRRRDRRVRRPSRPPSRRCSRCRTSWSRRTSARRRSRRRTRRARRSPRGGARARGRVRAVRGQPRGHRGELDRARRSSRSWSGSAGCSPRLAGGVVDTLEVSYEGQIADYDCKVLTLAALKGVLGPVVDEPVSFVNAPAIAEERGLVVRETKVGSARDYVNLVELRGVVPGPGRRTWPARSTASRTRRASSASTTTSSTCRRRPTWSWCATTTCPA